jgi:hypothetical protein
MPEQTASAPLSEMTLARPSSAAWPRATCAFERKQPSDMRVEWLFPALSDDFLGLLSWTKGPGFFCWLGPCARLGKNNAGAMFWPSPDPLGGSR